MNWDRNWHSCLWKVQSATTGKVEIANYYSEDLSNKKICPLLSESLWPNRMRYEKEGHG